MQHRNLGTANLAAYHDYIQSDHDYQIMVDIMTMEERPVGAADLTDGQVNTADGGRTATMTLSDPTQALTFGTSLAEDDTGVLWVNRIVRVRHVVDVPGVGTVSSVVFVGVPTSVTRSGGEVGVDLTDKRVLADHGTNETTYMQGWNASASINSILFYMTGETHLRIPSSPVTLSKSYTVGGMADDNVTPWKVAVRIAKQEIGWDLFYSADGYVTAEVSGQDRGIVDMKAILDFPDAQTDFSEFKNYVQVTSQKLKPAIVTLPASDRLSPSALSRNGVNRLLPLLVSDDNLKTQDAVDNRATAELKSASGLDLTRSLHLVPIFHLDNRDQLRLPGGAGTVTMETASIPLGVGGDMTVGGNKWVSKPVVVRRRRR